MGGNARNLAIYFLSIPTFKIEGSVVASPGMEKVELVMWESSPEY